MFTRGIWTAIPGIDLVVVYAPTDSQDEIALLLRGDSLLDPDVVELPLNLRGDDAEVLTRDFNRDGREDLVVLDGSDSLLALFGKGDGALDEDCEGCQAIQLLDLPDLLVEEGGPSPVIEVGGADLVLVDAEGVVDPIRLTETGVSLELQQHSAGITTITVVERDLVTGRFRLTVQARASGADLLSSQVVPVVSSDPVALPVDVSFRDQDGSETGQVFLGGLAPGEILRDGTREFIAGQETTRVEITDWELGSLTVELSGRFDAELTVAATTEEISNLDSRSDETSIVLDAPPTLADAVVINESQSISRLFLSGSVSSADDIDVYKLSGLGAGELLSIDLEINDAEAIVNLLDATGEVLLAGVAADSDLPGRAVVIPASGDYFLTVASPSSLTGDYKIVLADSPGSAENPEEAILIPLLQEETLRFEGLLAADEQADWYEIQGDDEVSRVVAIELAGQPSGLGIELYSERQATGGGAGDPLGVPFAQGGSALYAVLSGDRVFLRVTRTGAAGEVGYTVAVSPGTNSTSTSAATVAIDSPFSFEGPVGGGDTWFRFSLPAQSNAAIGIDNAVIEAFKQVDGQLAVQAIQFDVMGRGVISGSPTPGDDFDIFIKVKGQSSPSSSYLLRIADESRIAVGNGPIDVILRDLDQRPLDFNGDGETDAAILNYNSDSVSIFLGNGDGTFQQSAEFFLEGDAGPVSMVAGFFGSDDHLDLAVVTRDVFFIAVLHGLGDGTFSTQQFPISVFEDARPVSITAGDFNGDGFVDLATANQGSNTVTVFPGFAAGVAPFGISFDLSGEPSSITSGQFNADDITDLAVFSSETDTVSILLGESLGVFDFPLQSRVPVADTAFSIQLEDRGGSAPQSGMRFFAESSARVGLGLGGSLTG